MKTLLSLALALILAFSLCTQVKAAGLDAAVTRSVNYIQRAVPDPHISAIGGEWAVIGLARSGLNIPRVYFENYYRNVKNHLTANNGVLHATRLTEYSRVILALTAAGYDPRNVAGFNLTFPLSDFEQVLRQGINGPIWALIALDSGNYPIPINPRANIQATRELFVAEILRRQTPDGGWNLTAGATGAVRPNETGDPDITGMALQALAKYKHIPAVEAAINRALAFLSEAQDSNGGFVSWGASNLESVVQVVVALAELGIPFDDPRFIKNGNSLLDNLQSFQNPNGSFRRVSYDTQANQMSSEQGLYGLVAAHRQINGKSSLYRMGDD